MKAYLITTSAIFAIITLAHAMRLFHEGPGVASDPWFLLLTGVAMALCIWACLLLVRLRAPRTR
jgi:hypothetical protein